MIFEDAQPGPGAVERLTNNWTPTARYLLKVEVHMYAFSMAANVLLSFFPFLIVIITICRYALGWKGAEDIIFLALRDYFPDALGNFIERNLVIAVSSRRTVPVVSLLVLLYTANGIFLPLEVALNRAWGIGKDRHYIKNQFVSFLLTLACGLLVLVSSVLVVFNQQVWMRFAGPDWQWTRLGALTALKVALVPVSIFLLILIYRRLPNAKVPLRPIVPVAIVVGFALEVMKYVNARTWAWLNAKIADEYGPFQYSVTILLWSYLASMVVLAGAEWAARRATPDELQSVQGSG